MSNMDSALFRKLEEQISEIDGYISNNSVDICLPPYNAKCDGVTDETAIVQRAINERGFIKIGKPNANLIISDTILMASAQGITGLGRRNTTITMITDNKPMILFPNGGSSSIIKGVKLRYKNWQNATHTNGNAIATGRNVGQSIFDEIEIEGAYNGIYSPNNFYSNTVSNFWINVYQYSAMYFDGTGSTGCVFSNIYTTNWTNYNAGEKRTATYGIFFKGFSENILQQINIEHTKLRYGIYFNTCLNAKLQSIHFEGYEQVGDYNGLIAAGGSLTNISADSVTVYQCWVADGQATQMNLFSTYNGAKIEASNVVSRDNSVVHSVQKPTTGINTNLVYNGGGTNQDTLRLSFNNVFSQDNYFKNLSGVDQNQVPPHVIKYNDNVYYEERGGKKYLYRSSVPTTGTFAVGDRIVNTTLSGAKGISEWVCIVAGTFGTSRPYFIAIGDGRGTTENRPALTVDDRGFTYFDTTINKRLWWDGSKYTDANGEAL